jgi:hypothetical protein
LAQLVPGSSLADTLALLGRWGLSSSTRSGRLLLFEYPWFAGVSQRQQLLLMHEAGEVERVALQVDLQDESPANVQRLYARLRDQFLRQYGAPSQVTEEGQFNASWAEELAMGRLRYLMEWQSGRSRIRLGIPARMDGRHVLEVAVTPATGSALDTRNWSLELLR